MNLLTDDEIQYLLDGCHSSNTWTLVERTIAATIAKLASGVSVEPVATVRWDSKCSVSIENHAPDILEAGMKLYTTTAIAAARVAALEEAARVVEADAVKNPVTAYQLQYNISLEYIAKDIRELIGEKT